MPSLPPGRLTFGQIRDLALRRAGNPALIYDASVWLSQLLFELYVGWEWPFLYVAVSVPIVGPSFVLPTDFLKTQDDRGFEITTWNGATANGAVIVEKDRYTFDAVAAGQTAQGMPQIWTPDRATGVGLLYPVPAASTGVATLRYKQLPTADTTPPTANQPNGNDTLVPVFPYHLYLVQALYVIALQHEHDARADGEEARRDKQFEVLRQGAMPLRSQVSVIPLDPEVFSPVFSGD